MIILSWRLSWSIFSLIQGPLTSIKEGKYNDFGNLWQVIIALSRCLWSRAFSQQISEGLKPALQAQTMHLTI